MSKIFTVDNLLHALVAVAFVILLVLIFGQQAALPAAILAGIGLYLREVAQAGWRFSLDGSRHKHLEWIIGTAVGLVAALICVLIL
jgi:hypothetical protein